MEFIGFERKLNTHLRMLGETKEKPGRSFTTDVAVENIFVKNLHLM
jgi:hypothetical protein